MKLIVGKTKDNREINNHFSTRLNPVEKDQKKKL